MPRWGKFPTGEATQGELVKLNNLHAIHRTIPNHHIVFFITFSYFRNGVALFQIW